MTLTKDPYTTTFEEKAPTLSKEDKVSAIATHMREVMKILGLDLSDDSLQKTPERIAKMYVHEVFSGLDPETFPNISFVKNRFSDDTSSGYVHISGSFTSFCEHHFVPMTGVFHVGYVPDKKLIGLSKVPRIVRFFSKRPQLQERLTAQVSDCLISLLETDNVAIHFTAQHQCVLARGIEDSCSATTTHRLKGAFCDDLQLRQEFIAKVNS